MPLRFFRRIRVLPGVTLNVSKRGVSTSVGVRGAHVTVGNGRVRETVGIPGTGVSYTTSQPLHQAHQEAAGTAQVPSAPKRRRIWPWVVLALLFGPGLLVGIIAKLTGG